jgi:hypothetical protein
MTSDTRCVHRTWGRGYMMKMNVLSDLPARPSRALHSRTSSTRPALIHSASLLAPVSRKCNQRRF